MSPSLTNATKKELTATIKFLVTQGEHGQARAVTAWLLEMDPKNEFARGMVEVLTQPPEPTRDVFPILIEPPPEMPLEEADDRVRRLLQRRVSDDVKLDEIAFSDVIEYLRDVSGCDIIVDWKAIQRCGLRRDEKVSVRLHNPKLAKAIYIILDLISTPQCKLTYIVDGGVIIVGTTSELLPRILTTRIYDIRDLVVPPPDSDGTSAAPQELRPAPVPATMPTTQRSAVEVARTSSEESGMMKEIIVLIRETVAPDSWKEAGGSATIRPLLGMLAIRQTSETHRQLEGLFAAFRQGRGHPR